MLCKVWGRNMKLVVHHQLVYSVLDLDRAPGTAGCRLCGLLRPGLRLLTHVPACFDLWCECRMNGGLDGGREGCMISLYPVCVCVSDGAQGGACCQVLCLHEAAMFGCDLLQVVSF